MPSTDRLHTKGSCRKQSRRRPPEPSLRLLKELSVTSQKTEFNSVSSIIIGHGCSVNQKN